MVFERHVHDTYAIYAFRWDADDQLIQAQKRLTMHHDDSTGLMMTLDAAFDLLNTLGEAIEHLQDGDDNWHEDGHVCIVVPPAVEEEEES